MAPDIIIHNKCNEVEDTICLIPFSRLNDEKLQSVFEVRKTLAKNILAGDSGTVKLKNYDLSNKGPNSQIYMLFRAGKFPDRIEPQLDELFLFSDLAKKDEWNLSLDRNRQVIGGPKNAAGQTSSGANAAGPQDESQLGKLKKEVQELQDKVKYLETKMAELEKRLAKLKC